MGYISRIPKVRRMPNLKIRKTAQFFSFLRNNFIREIRRNPKENWFEKFDMDLNPVSVVVFLIWFIFSPNAVNWYFEISQLFFLCVWMSCIDVRVLFELVIILFDLLICSFVWIFVFPLLFYCISCVTDLSLGIENFCFSELY